MNDVLFVANGNCAHSWPIRDSIYWVCRFMPPPHRRDRKRQFASAICWILALWLILFGIEVVHAACGDDWAWSTHGNVPLSAVAWDGNKFVAVGQAGTVMTSEDGLVWTARSVGTSGWLFGITWSGSQFVTVGRDGILTSPDGVAWTLRSSGTVEFLNAVTWNGSQFVAVGDSGVALTSLDGVAWTLRSSGTRESLFDITWSGSQFVAVGTLGAVVTSPDGVVWTSRSSGTHEYPEDQEDLYGVTWSGSQFVAVGDSGVVLTSPDGVGWTPRSSGITTHLDGITWNGSQFVAVGRWGWVLTSPDGIVWTPRNLGATTDFSSIVWNGHQFLGVGASGTVLASPDGSAWTLRNVGVWRNLSGITWGRNQFVAVGHSGTVMTSPDGLAWTRRDSQTRATLDDVTWDGGQFVVVGKATILTSPDGVDWRTAGQLDESGEPVARVAWGGSQFVMVGTNKILTSPDGWLWTSRYPMGSPDFFFGVAWGGIQWVVVGKTGTILTSPDGIIWTRRSSGTLHYLMDVAWNGHQFVAVGEAGTVLTSPDGVVWTPRRSGTAEWLNRIIWTDSQFVAVGDSGTVLTSPDGVAWTPRVSTTTQPLWSVAYSGSQLVAVGDSGTIVNSSCLRGQYWSLDVAVAGLGRVTSYPAGIACGPNCSAEFSSGTVVTLYPKPELNHLFTGWGGACSGNGSCQVTLDAAKSVNAVFAKADTEVIGTSDLGFGLVAVPASGAFGGRMDYTGTVTNFGPNEAKGIQVTFALPSGAQLLNIQDGCVPLDSLLRCSLGNLVAHGKATTGFSLVLTAAGSITASGEVVSGVNDNAPGNNAMHLETVVVLPPASAAANLKLALTGPAAVKRSKTASYKTQLKNLGPASASAAQVGVDLPAGASFVSSLSDRSCSLRGGAIACRVGTLSAKKRRSIKVALNFANAGRFLIRAQASSWAGDLKPDNNQASVKTRVK